MGLAPPLYRNEAEARQRIGRIGFMARAFVLDSALAHQACAWVCAHRNLAGRVAQLVRPDLPGPIARDGVQHTWRSYSQSLERVLLAATIRVEVPAVRARLYLVAGADDHIAPPELIHDLAQPGRVTVETWSGSGHDLPLTDPARCVATIVQAAETAGISG